MQNLFDLYPTNYIGQGGRQFSIPDLTVLTDSEAQTAMASAPVEQMTEQNRNNSAKANMNVRNPVPARNQNEANRDNTQVKMDTAPIAMYNRQQMPQQAMQMRKMQQQATQMQTNPMPPSNMAERIKDRQGCYIFAAIDLGCGHNTPIEGVLYETGDDYFSIFDSARRTLTSYHIDNIKWFTTMFSCGNVMDFTEDTIINK